MRTIKPRISPGCSYCNFDHDPAIECRFKPQPERTITVKNWSLAKKHECRSCGQSVHCLRHPTIGWLCQECWRDPDPPAAPARSLKDEIAGINAQTDKIKQATAEIRALPAIHFNADEAGGPGYYADPKIGRQHAESDSDKNSADRLADFVARGTQAQAAVDAVLARHAAPDRDRTRIGNAPENGADAAPTRRPADGRLAFSAAQDMDLCIAGESAIQGVCGDPDCVCAPESLKQLPRCRHGYPMGTAAGVEYGCDVCADGLENGSQKPVKLQYVARYGQVLHGSANVATARSNAFAKKIAKALNHFQECPGVNQNN